MGASKDKLPAYYGPAKHLANSVLKPFRKPFRIRITAARADFQKNSVHAMGETLPALSPSQATKQKAAEAAYQTGLTVAHFHLENLLAHMWSVFSSQVKGKHESEGDAEGHDCVDELEETGYESDIEDLEFDGGTRP